MIVEKRLERIYQMLAADSNLLLWVENKLEEYKVEGESWLTAEQLDELEKRRLNHVAEESASYSWSEVKQDLIDKYGLPT